MQRLTAKIENYPLDQGEVESWENWWTLTHPLTATLLMMSLGESPHWKFTPP